MPRIDQHPDFSSPLTGALFDRTVEQRLRHAQITTMLADERYPADVREVEADRRMYGEFLTAIHSLVEDRTKADVAEATRRSTNPSVDVETIRFVQRQRVAQEIGLLHDALPTPMLDRFEESAATSGATAVTKAAPKIDAPRRES